MNKCDKCGAVLVVRRGPYGRFAACPNSRPGDNHGTRSLEPKSWVGWASEGPHSSFEDAYDELRPY